jgi:hypothetical protein
MGLFSKSGTTTTTGTSTNTANLNRSTQRTNPQWIEDIAKGFGGEITDLGQMDPRSFVPGTSPLQEKGFQAVAGLGGMAEAFGGGLDMTAAAGNSAAPRTEFVKSSKMIGDFMDPYLKDVVDTSLADFDFGAGNTRAAQDLDLARSGAFGGSGAALTKSATEGEILRGRGSLAANLRSDGWRTALQAAQNEAARKQGANDLNAGLYGQQLDRSINAGRSLADIAGAFGGEKRADAATTLAAGGQQRDIAGEEQRAVLDFLKERQDLFGGVMPELFGGENTEGTTTATGTSSSKSKTKSNPSLMDIGGQALQIAALFAGSDRTIKRDIVRLFTRPDGLGVYLFRYANDLARQLWGSGWKIGVMAQEVQKVKPEAVARHPAGFLMVDYAQL